MRVFGYNGDKIDKAEADAIKDACKDLLNGSSLYGIAQQWNSRGIKTVSGAPWNGTSVRQVLTRPRNAGLQVYGVHAANRDQKGKSLKDKINAAIITDAKVSWEPIIDRELFDLVLAKLSDPSRHTGKSRARVHLLSGLAYCGLCGRKMGTVNRPTKTGRKRMVYQCKNMGCMKVVRDMVRTDQVVIDTITAMLALPEAAQLFASKTVDTKALSEQVAKYRAKIAAAEREYAEGDIAGKDLKLRRETLQPKIDAIEAQLLGATTSRKLDGLIGNSEARQVFESLTLDRQREVIDIVARVTIMPNPRDADGKVRTGGVFDHTLIRVERHQDD